MHYFNLLYYIFGYVKIDLHGAAVEKFLNMAIKNGVNFWDLEIKEDKIKLKTSLKDFHKLKKIARKTGCTFKIAARKGIPFYLRKINKRKGFVLGCIIFVTAIYYFSFFVWFIQVEGNEKLSGEEVLNIAEKHGLNPGIRKDDINVSKLAEIMTSEDDRLVWVGIEIKGARALLEVVEREEEHEEDKYHGYGDIVAVERGNIEKIITLSGFPLVSKGDEVNKDEILIAGRIVPTKIEEQTGDIEWEDLAGHSRVAAKGFIYGTMWFKEKAEVLLERQVEKRTTNKFVRRGIQIGDKIFYLDLKSVPFIEYDVEKIETTRLSDGFKTPFRMFKKKYYETKEVKEKLSESEGKEKARKLLIEKISKQIPPNSKVVSKEFEYQGIENGRLIKKLEMEVEGNMGKLKSF